LPLIDPCLSGIYRVAITQSIPHGGFMSEVEKKMLEILSLMDSAIELIPDSDDIADYENIAMVCLCNARHEIRNAIYEMQP